MAVPNPALAPTAAANATIKLTGLPSKLVKDGLLTEAVAEEAFLKARQHGKPFVSYIVQEKLLSSKQIAHAASNEFGVPLLDIDAVDLDKEVYSLVDEKLIRKHNALPLFKRGKRLFVAVSDPTNIAALEEIRFHTNTITEPILVDEERLVKAIERTLEEADTSLANLEGDGLDGLETADTEENKEDEAKDASEDAPVVRFINKMLTDAIKMGASDLHFEPYEKYYRVRFRVDGMLRTMARPPLGLKLKMAARIKVMARLDVSERRVPQDGRIKLKLSKTKSIDFRVSTCPTLFGEKIVMRILNSDASALDIEMLGYEEEQKRLFLTALEKPYGMLLVTGPTGSGKTVSLYTGINILNREGVNISTAEDPVEINLPGINQVQIDERTGMTFDKALKAFLRQDPDIILVGEIRDIVTGGIAIKAASTGHMVMATLHTNDAPQTLTRMMDMGLAPFAIASSVNLITAQRLARRLCKLCKRELTIVTDRPPRNDLEIHKETLLAEGFLEEHFTPELKLYRENPKGCEKCSGGFKGRVGIYQVMPISEEMRRLIMEGRTSIALADQARREGIPDLRASALKKFRDGVTSLSEINRVTQE